VIINKTKIIPVFLIIFILLSNSSSVYSNNPEPPLNRVLFIFDASQSMLGRWQSGRKIDIAKNLLSKMVDSLSNIDNLEIALRVYGHKSPFPPKDCEDSYLEVNFLKSNIAADLIKKKLSVIKSRGTTPIARSLEEGAKDFPSTSSRNIVILITDGMEECGMDPCQVSKSLQSEGIILKPFVIGVGLDKTYKTSFDCVGKFFDATNESEFSDILNIVISHVIDNTTVQINLLDQDNKATETNVNVTLYDNFTGLPKYNYIHTLDNYGYPDTLGIDPVSTYNIVAHTIPPVSLNNIQINPGRHNIIPLKTPQGKLEINIKSKNKYQYIIRKSGVDSILHVQDLNRVDNYLVGKYNIEVLTLPRKKINIEIKGKQKTTIPIRSPGLANIILPSKGFGGIYTTENNKLEEIYQFSGKKKEHRISLLPGKYLIVYRSISARSSLYTKQKYFTINSDKSKLIKF
jgi:Ca-activated chloride channel family protein